MLQLLLPRRTLAVVAACCPALAAWWRRVRPGALPPHLACTWKTFGLVAKNLRTIPEFSMRAVMRGCEAAHTDEGSTR